MAALQPHGLFRGSCLKPRRALGQDERRNPAMPLVGVGHRIDHQEIRDTPVRDEAFRALEVPAAVHAPRAGLHVGGVGSGGGLGQRKGPQRLAGRGLGQPALFLGLGSAQQDGIGRQIMRRHRRGGRAAGPRHDRHRPQQRRRGNARTAVFLGQVRAHHPGLGQHPQLVVDEGAGGVGLGGLRGDLLGADAFQQVAKQPLFLGQHVPVVAHAMVSSPSSRRMLARSAPSCGAAVADTGFSPSKRTGCPTMGA